MDAGGCIKESSRLMELWIGRKLDLNTRCNQKKGVEYTQNYALVAKMSTIRAFLAVAAMNQWHTCQMDVQNAFSHGDLKEEIYMHIPMGYKISEDYTRQGGARSTCMQTQKGLYGIKQSLMQWFTKLSTTLLSFGFIQSHTDHSLFVQEKNDTFTAIIIYVDD